MSDKAEKDTRDDGWGPLPKYELTAEYGEQRWILSDGEKAIHVVPLAALTAALEERAEALGALSRLAQALHGLSDDPQHERDTFADCKHYLCEAARHALRVGRPLGG